MKEFLPSNKIVAFLIIPVFSIIIFYILNSYILGDKKNLAFASDDLSGIVQEEKNKDSDNDGLKDWEERLYGTDIKIKDSDKDGVNDGDEVKKGSDPNDHFNIEFKKREKEIAEKKEHYFMNDPNLTQTDKFSRDFLLRVISLKESDLIHNESAQEMAVEELLRRNTVISLDRKYEIKDLNIKNNVSRKVLKENILKAYKSSGIEGLEDTGPLFAKYLDSNNNTNYLKILFENSKKYETFENKLINIEVSKDMADMFLNYINLVRLQKEVTRAVSRMDKDPIKAIHYFNLTDKVLINAHRDAGKLFQYLNK